MPPLQSAWDLHHSSGEPHTVIRIKNLSTVLPLGLDAWGRGSQPQPVQISSTISLVHPFTTSSPPTTNSLNQEPKTETTIAPDTLQNSIHYGILSKSILQACAEFKDICEDEVLPVPMCLKALVCWICWWCTGEDVMPKGINGLPSTLSSPGNSSPLLNPTMNILGSQSLNGSDHNPILKGVAIKEFEIVVMLPKASLLGNGISLTGNFSFQKEKTGLKAYSMKLKLHDLRIPTLIGVNPHERAGKQIVGVNVEVDGWDRMVDCYPELEEIVVKTVEESSFQTLEALGSLICERTIKYFLLPQISYKYLQSPKLTNPHLHILNHPRLRISLEKPTAVIFADAPIVEMLMDTDPTRNDIVGGLWEDARRSLGSEGGRVRKPPFPLLGRLDEWIVKNEA